MRHGCTSNHRQQQLTGPSPAFGERLCRRRRQLGRNLATYLVMAGLLLPGCVAQQADLKQAERELQRRIKQSTEELAQTRARQNQEITTLRDQELPKLHGRIDEAQHTAKAIQAKQDDIQARLASLGAADADLRKRLAESEKRAADNDGRATEEGKRLGWVEKQLVDQDALIKSERERSKTELDALRASVEQLKTHVDTAQQKVLDAVQKTNATLAQRVDSRLEEQQKEIRAIDNTKGTSVAQLEGQTRMLSEQVAKFSQALGDFKQVLGSLGEKLVQQEQVTKQLSVTVDQELTAMAKRTENLPTRLDANSKATTEHLNEVNRSVASVAKALETSSQQFMARAEEQDRKIEGLSKELGQFQAQVQTINKNIENQQQFLQTVSKELQEQHQFVESVTKNVESQHQFLKDIQQVQQQVVDRLNQSSRRDSSVAVAEAATLPLSAPSAPQAPPSRAADSKPVAHVSDRDAYDRILNKFKQGDYEGSQQGFTEFLTQYPSSELAPNARFWLGESYYGKKDYVRAIDAYDQVQLNHPSSEKVPAALLKKGYSYLALKDRKRAASTLRQVIDLYPKSTEADKALDKLSQLKEPR